VGGNPLIGNPRLKLKQAYRLLLFFIYEQAHRNLANARGLYEFLFPELDD
jgi:hypothetical protein